MNSILPTLDLTQLTPPTHYGTLELDWCISCGVLKCQIGSIYCSPSCFRTAIQQDASQSMALVLALDDQPLSSLDSPAWDMASDDVSTVSESPSPSPASLVQLYTSMRLCSRGRKKGLRH
ncbi:hypothetical protein HDU91_006514 [Kappamyces sp. JEL0680]|nr:hypothetical protein HDU91_006514 [Kappamyces sp. JEL0680]